MKNENYIRHASYFRNSIAYDNNFGTLMYNDIHRRLFSFFQNFDFFGVVSGVKGQKMAQNDTRILSVTLHISVTRPSQIVCTITTVHVSCSQAVLRVHENSYTVLIPLCKNLNLPISRADHYALRK